MAIMLITHAMGVVAEVAQRVVVMYAGMVVEEASVESLFARPAPSLHAGPDPLDPAHRHRGPAQGAARADPRHRAQADRPGRRLPLRAALQVRRAANASRRRRRCASRCRATRCAASSTSCRPARRCWHERRRDDFGNAAAAGQGPGQALPDHRRLARPRGRERARRERRQLRPRRRRDARPGRRVGLRQEHDRPLHPAPDRADLGRGLVRGQGRHPRRQGRAARAGARHADHLPGSVRLAQSAHDGRRDRRRGADDPQAGEDAAPSTRRASSSCSRRWASTPTTCAAIRTSSRAASASASASPARSPSARSWSSATRRCRRSTSRSRPR